MKWIFDYKPTDVFWCTADVGWVTGHTYIAYGPLACGATEIVFEGVPTYPDAGRFWKMIQDHKVSVFYTAPTAIRSLIKARRRPAEAVRPVEALRMLGTVGEPINPEAWMWYYKTVGKSALPDRRHLVADRDRRPHDHAAARRDAAEAGLVHVAAAGHHGGDRRRDGPRRRVRQGRHPGHQAAVAVDDPHHLGRSGPLQEELLPGGLPGQAITSPATARSRDLDGYSAIMGRIDDVLNVSGHRLGTMEIESALVANPLVAEAAVVGRPDDLTGEAVCAFVVLKQARPDGADAEKIAKQLRDWVGKEIGPIAKPKDIRFGDNLPKTRSGKIMRRLLRSIAKDEEITQDTSTLENPAILDQLKQVTERSVKTAAARAVSIEFHAPTVSRTRAACRASRQASEVREVVRPAEFGLAELEVAERAAGRDVGQRIRLAVAPRLVAQLARQLRDTRFELLPLALDPFLALLALRPLPSSTIAIAASHMPSASASHRLTAIRCRPAPESAATPGSPCRDTRRSRASRTGECRRRASGRAPCRAD